MDYVAFDELHGNLVKSVDDMSKKLFAEQQATATPPVLSMEDTIQNYHLMYYLLYYHDSQFSRISRTLRQIIRQRIADSFDHRYTIHQLVTFIERCERWCAALEQSYDPYVNYVTLYRQDRGKDNEHASFREIFCDVLVEIIEPHWPTVNQKLLHLVVQYKHRLLSTIRAQENYSTDRVTLLQSYICQTFDSDPDQNSNVQPCVDVEDGNDGNEDDNEDGNEDGEEGAEWAGGIPENATQIPHLLTVLRRYFPQHITMLCATTKQRHGLDDVDLYTRFNILNDTDTTDDRDTLPSIIQFCDNFIKQLYTECKTAVMMQGACQTSSPNTIQSCDAIHQLCNSNASAIGYLRFMDLYEACAGYNVISIRECLARFDMFKKCLQAVKKASPEHALFIIDEDNTFAERHFKSAFQSTLRSQNYNSEERVSECPASPADGTDVPNAEVDAAEAKPHHRAIFRNFSDIIERMIHTVELCTPTNANSARQVYCFDATWFRPWFEGWYLNKCTATHRQIPKPFEVHFFIIWLHNMLQESTEYVEKAAVIFFKLFLFLEDKDIFMEIYMHMVRKRFLHRQYNVALDSLIHLHLESVVGQHPLLHQYQHMISEQHYPPPCWQGMRGRVLARANWKNIPSQGAPLHPKLAENLEGYQYAYAFSYPDRVLEWATYYSGCQLRIQSDNRAGISTVVCSMMIGNALLYIADSPHIDAESALIAAKHGASEARFWCEHLHRAEIVTCIDKRGIHDRKSAIYRLSTYLPEHCVIPTPDQRRYNAAKANDQCDNTAESHADESTTPPQAAPYQVEADRAFSARAGVIHVLKHLEQPTTDDDLYTLSCAAISLFHLQRDMFDAQLTKLIDMGYAQREDGDGQKITYIP